MIDHTIFRNYDIRGEYAKELNEDAVYQISRSFVDFSGAKRIVVGYDARVSSPSLKEAVFNGLVDGGAEVVDVGLCATDVVYFATWHNRCDAGIMITASHMPGKYNGMKFLRINKDGFLAPVGRGLGMEELEEMTGSIDVSIKKEGGKIVTYDIWPEYVTFIHGFGDIENMKPLKVVMDAANGTGGVVAKKVFSNLPIEIIPLYFEPDGTFPNHEANPFLEKNRRDIVAKVKEVNADLGVAWDADCDRAYFIDEKGKFINGDLITALIAIYFLEKHSGANIVYDLRSSWAVKDWIAKLGGLGHKDKVGHSYIKKTMRETNSVFGGEVSGHYYFAANSYMDNGFIPVMIILDLLSKENKNFSEFVSSLGEYYLSGEINFKVENIPAKLTQIENKYSDAIISKLDGLSVDYPDWHFNVRPSANDPVMRLNLEAKSEVLLNEKFKEVSNLIGVAIDE
jgi:phosphomannomutase